MRQNRSFSCWLAIVLQRSEICCRTRSRFTHNRSEVTPRGNSVALPCPAHNVHSCPAASRPTCLYVLDHSSRPPLRINGACNGPIRTESFRTCMGGPLIFKSRDRVGSASFFLALSGADLLVSKPFWGGHGRAWSTLRRRARSILSGNRRSALRPLCAPGARTKTN